MSGLRVKGIICSDEILEMGGLGLGDQAMLGYKLQIWGHGEGKGDCVSALLSTTAGHRAGLTRQPKLSRSWPWVLANHRSQIYLWDYHKSKPIFMCLAIATIMLASGTSQRGWGLAPDIPFSVSPQLTQTSARTRGSHFCLMNYVKKARKGRVGHQWMSSDESLATAPSDLSFPTQIQGAREGEA